MPPRQSDRDRNGFPTRPGHDDARAQQLRLAMTFSVDDPAALWEAAAQKGLEAPGMTLEDMVAVIGPREDPSLNDCLALLLHPAITPGCALEAIDVDSADSRRSANVA